MNYLMIISTVLSILLLIILTGVVISLTKKTKNTEDKVNDTAAKISDNSAKLAETSMKLSENSSKMDMYFKSYADVVQQNQKSISEQQELRLRTLEEGIARLRNDNNLQLENMRRVVDDKLQTTLDEKLASSFGLVNERLEQVYKGLGEMQNVASSVGDLKKVLSNTKTRGILGEVQLGAIIKQILTKEQYEENVATVENSRNTVEFAIKMPGGDDGFVYLPIDSKFPGETYHKLVDSYEDGNSELIKSCKKELLTRFRSEAKDIREKYVKPPRTTEFAIMFLPFEGLYAEAVNMGMIETLQNDFKITIAGPTTMAALLNSLQMGFHTLAIEKKSSEVWKILSEVKTEFAKFDDGLSNARDKIRLADEQLDKLIGTRTRAINRKLKDVMLLEEDDQNQISALEIYEDR